MIKPSYLFIDNSIFSAKYLSGKLVQFQMTS
jgi:hypothetical protein